MTRSKAAKLAAFLAVALGVGLSGNALAQYSTVVGNTSGGGNTVVGNGTNLGPLETGDGNLSNVGFDSITFNLGSTTATGLSVDTIRIYTSGNTLLNNGSIFGSDGVNAGDEGFNALAFGNSELSGETITNNVLMQGGNGASDTSYHNSGGDAGNAMYFSAGGLDSVTITNTGSLLGGTGGDGGGGGGYGGSGGAGIYFSVEDFTNILITNSGTIAGGNGGVDTHYRGTGGSGGYGIEADNYIIDGFTIVNTGAILGGNGQGDTGYRRAGGDGGEAIGIFGYDGVNNITISSTNGLIQGGYGGDSGSRADAGRGGNAISIETEDNNVNAVSISNAGGSILGGNGGNGTDDHAYGGDGGRGIYVYASTNITNVNIFNSGMIQGGKGGDVEYEANAANGGDAIYLDADDGNLTNFALNNTGTILGGNGGAAFADYSSGGSGGTGLDVYSDGVVSNFTLNNTGTIQGGKGGDIVYDSYAGYGGDAIYIEGYEGINGMTIVNSGNILGGNGGGPDSNNYDYIGGGNGGTGIDLYSQYQDIANVSITNTGSILGGNGGNSTYESYYGGYAGDAVYIESDDRNVVNTTLVNSGVIAGGKGGNALGYIYEGFGGGGYGLDIYAWQNVTNTNITNLAGGQIRGGDGGSAVGVNSYAYGGYGGYGISVEANDADVNGFTLNNAGIIAGGNGGNGDDANDYNGGSGGYGVYVLADVNLLNVSIVNSGLIVGGNGGNQEAGDSAVKLEADYGSVNNVSVTNTGAFVGGNGGFSPFNEGGDGYDALRVLGYGDYNTNMNNVTVMNAGQMLGGNGGGTGADGYYSGDGGDAIEIGTYGSITNSSVTNVGVIAGGNAGNGGGVNGGGYGGDGLYVWAEHNITNFTLNNFGAITGGNGSGNGYNGGAGVDMVGTPAPATGDSNIVLNNYGVIRGGDGLNGATSGPGMYLETTGAVVNNYGTISAGVGAQPYAIILNGGGNVINLYGHSITQGMIAASGPTDSNVLNIKLSGVSPAEALSVQQQLAAEGVVPGQDSSGSITIRGLTIQWDPIIVNLQTTSYQLQGLTPNQQAVGANLDSFLFNPSGDMLNMLNAIDGSGNVPLALEALSPQPYQLYSEIAFANATFLTQSIDARLNNLRDGSESIDTIGLGGDTDKTSAGFSKDGKDNKHVAVPEKAVERRWGFFATGNGVFSNVDAHGGDLSDQGFTSAGLTMGVDGKINDNWVAGLLFNYEYTSADLDSHGSTANVETFGGGVYGGYHNGPWYANGLATYGHNSYDSTRNIAFSGFNRNATGSTNGDQFLIDADGGYDFHITDKVTVGPIFGLQYVHLDVDSFSESGAGAADLAVNSQNASSLRSRLGFHAEYKTQVAKEVAFATEIRATWQHEFLDDSRSISSSFIGSGLGAFSVQTTNPQRDSALCGVGANLTVRDRMTLFFDYDVQAGQSSYLEQSVKGGVKFSF